MTNIIGRQLLKHLIKQIKRLENPIDSKTPSLDLRHYRPSKTNASIILTRIDQRNNERSLYTFTDEYESFKRLTKLVGTTDCIELRHPVNIKSLLIIGLLKWSTLFYWIIVHFITKHPFVRDCCMVPYFLMQLFVPHNKFNKFINSLSSKILFFII